MLISVRDIFEDLKVDRLLRYQVGANLVILPCLCSSLKKWLGERPKQLLTDISEENHAPRLREKSGKSKGF